MDSAFSIGVEASADIARLIIEWNDMKDDLSGLIEEREALRAELSTVNAGLADAETSLHVATIGAERAN